MTAKIRSSFLEGSAVQCSAVLRFLDLFLSVLPTKEELVCLSVLFIHCG